MKFTGFNTASGMAQLQLQRIGYNVGVEVDMRFNTASGMAQLQLTIIFRYRFYLI